MSVNNICSFLKNAIRFDLTLTSEEMTNFTDNKTVIGVILVIVISLFGGWHLLGPKVSGFQTLEGESIRLKELEGKVILMDFMATWCGPCQASMSDLLELHDELGDKVVFISISVDPQQDTKKIMDKWKEEWGAEWMHVRDTVNPPLSQRYKIRVIPTYIIIDQTGEIVHRHTGLTSKDTIRGELRELLDG